MEKTGVKIVRDFHRLSDTTRISEKGKEYSQVTATRKPKGLVYEIKEDTVRRFSHGQKITQSEYNSVKKNYDIRMKDWVGDSQGLGKKIFFISGSKRDLIKDFLDERKYVITIQPHHYVVRGNGEKVTTLVIKDEIRKMGLKFLWIHVIGETGYDRASRVLKL